jgi:hypothetical protein
MQRFLVVLFLAAMGLPLQAMPLPAVALASNAVVQDAIPLGESGTIGEFSLVVDAFTPEVSDMLDPAGPGIGSDEQLVKIDLTITNDGADSQPFPLFNYVAAGNRGVLETVAKNGVCDWRGSLWDYFGHTNIAAGNSISFFLCSPVPVEDIPALRLGVQDYRVGQDAPILWFDLGNEANVDPQVAMDQAEAARNSVTVENPSFDDPGAASEVISTGNLTGELLDYQPDATDDLVDAGLGAPLEGLSLAQVEIRITNITEDVVLPEVELVGADGVGYEPVHRIPVDVEKDAWSIALLPGGQADMVLVFPVHADDAGNRLLAIGESPSTAAGLGAPLAWLNPDTTQPAFTSRASVAPGTDVDESVKVPFGSRVSLEAMTLSIADAEFDPDGSAMLHILVENTEQDAFMVSPDIYIGVVGTNAPCEMQRYDGSTSTQSDPIGMLAPNAAFLLTVKCTAGVNDAIFISHYLIDAPNGFLTAEFAIDPATAVASPEDTPTTRNADETAGEQASEGTLSPADMLIRLTDGNGYSLQDVRFDDFQFLGGKPVQDLDADMVTAYEDAGIIDLYITWDDFANADGDVYSVSSRMVTFGNDDDAAAYTASLFDQVKATAGDDLKHLRLVPARDLPGVEGNIVGWKGEVRSDDDELQPYLRYVWQSGRVVISVQIGGPSAEVNATVLDAMITAQADCLAAASTCAPIPFPVPPGAANGRPHRGALTIGSSWPDSRTHRRMV